MASKEQMIEALKDGCGCSCLIEPNDCKCFIPVTPEIAFDLGIDFEDMESITTKEECLHYQDTEYFIDLERDNLKLSLIDMIVDDKELSNDRASATEYVEKSLKDGLTSSQILMNIASKKVFASMGIGFKPLEDHNK